MPQCHRDEVVLIDMDSSANFAAASWPNGDLWQSNACEMSHTTIDLIHVDICRYVYPFRHVIVSDDSIPHLFQRWERALKALGAWEP